MDTKALRQKILDLAIRGKLVPQDPNDEPASVLLERIREQKQQMFKEGKLKKKDIKNDSIIFVGEDNLHYEKFADGTVKCIEDEIPFEVPEGWEWARIASVSSIVTDGEHKTPHRCENYSGYYLLSARNIQNSFLLLDNVDYVDREEYSRISKRCNPKRNDVLISCSGSVGRVAVVEDDNHYVMVRSAAMIRFINLNPYFGMYALQSHFLQLQIQKSSKQTAQANLFQGAILNLLLPIPPFKAQREIAKKVSGLFKDIHEIENEKIIIDDLLKRTKAKILDMAIRGKLVPQNPDDEPASALLKRIRAKKKELVKQRKIKRDKKESIIFKGEDNSYYEKIESVIRCINSEIPFKIPDGWAYERLGNICSVARGGSPRPIENYLTDDKNGLNWIKIGDTEQGGKYIFSTKEKIRSDGLNKTRYVHCGDFLLTNSMSFGRPYILKTDGCIHDGWLVIGEVETVFNQDFLYYMLSSSAMYNALSILAAGSTVKNLKSDSVKSLIVPIPPIEEQKAIATQVETLLTITAQVEKSLS
ncbi:Type-1 restriction enzyme EcoKI specificity protein [Eubacteriaceae bacterium CHKCI004]|nr:Type-1 restriction enzyme EcoKI specificity protein [Eubacteriaceae bacterium CHKCI004]